MADKRVFTIQIDGIEKSTQSSLRLVDALGLVAKSIEKVNKASAKTEAALNKATKATKKSTEASTARTQALNQEERAQADLTQAQNEARSSVEQLAQAQERANATLADRNTSLQNNVSQENAAQNSVSALKKRLKELNEEWERTDVDSSKFRELTTQIGEVNNQLQQMEALSDRAKKLGGSLSALNTRINEAADQMKGFVGLIQSGLEVVNFFGEENKEVSEVITRLTKITTIINSLQEINNKLFKEGTLIAKARIVVDKLVSKGLLSQTIAQTALNVATKAFPAMFIIGAIVAVAGVLVDFFSKTKDATDGVDGYKSSLDDMTFSTKEARDAHDAHISKVKELELEYQQLTGQLTDYEAALIRIADQKQKALEENEKLHKQALENIEDNFGFFDKIGEKIKKTTYEDFIPGLGLSKIIKDYKEIEEEEQNQITAANDDKVNNDLAIEQAASKQKVIAKEKEIQEKEKLDKKYSAGLLKGKEREVAQLKIEHDEAIKEAKKKGADLALVEEYYAQRYAEIEEKSNKQRSGSGKGYADQRKQIIQSISKLEQETNKLTQENVLNIIQANREQIKTIEEVNHSYADQQSIIEEQAAETVRAVIKEFDVLKESALKSGLDITKIEEDKNDRILALNVKLSNDLIKLEKEKAQKIKAIKDDIVGNRKDMIGLEQEGLEIFYSSIENSINNVKKTDSKGTIDVDATLKNIEEANLSLNEYLDKLGISKENIITYYDQIIATYDEDSIEFKKANNEKAKILQWFANKYEEINKRIDQNIELSENVVGDAFKQKLEELQEHVNNILSGLTAVFDAFGMIFDSQMDAAKDKYDEISELYDEVVSKCEESTNRIQELEEQAKTARGGRALVLQQQITSEMEYNKRLAEQEKQLAKEKEKQEKEIAKKEKQQKKLQLASDIVTGIAGTASAVVGALGSHPFTPANILLAKIVGAMGLLQVGIMTSQLAKLEKGGLLKGKRHRDGGMRVEGTNIEVEGGEYVINREATRNNLKLLEYINNSKRPVDAAAIPTLNQRFNMPASPIKIMMQQGGMMPTVEPAANNEYTSIIEAINTIDFSPVVSVQDINRVQQNVTEVRTLSGL